MQLEENSNLLKLSFISANNIIILVDSSDDSRWFEVEKQQIWIAVDLYEWKKNLYKFKCSGESEGFKTIKYKKN